MTTATQKAQTLNRVGLTLLAGLPLFTLLPLGLDIFLPAVYQISEYFGVSGIAALAINIYMLFWGIGQLIWGGVADAIGKRNTALIGLVIFALGSFFISGIEQDASAQFLAYRALQSFGGSACFTAIFALIRVRFEGEVLNQAYSYLNGILAFVPVSAPLLGAYIIESSSWFMLFTIMATLGAFSILWILLTLPDDRRTKTADGNQAGRAGLVQRYLAVAVNPRFRTYLFFALIAQTLFIYYLTVAPLYLIGRVGVSQVGFGQMFMVIALVFMGASFLAPKIRKVMAIKRIIAWSLTFILAGGLLMFAMAEIVAWYALILPMVLIAVGCTILLGSCPANALADFKENAGVASGLYTATTFGVGALIAALFTQLMDSANLAQVSMVYVLLALLAFVMFKMNHTIRTDAQ